MPGRCRTGEYDRDRIEGDGDREYKVGARCTGAPGIGSSEESGVSGTICPSSDSGKNNSCGGGMGMLGWAQCNCCGRTGGPSGGISENLSCGGCIGMMGLAQCNCCGCAGGWSSGKAAASRDIEGTTPGPGTPHPSLKPALNSSTSGEDRVVVQAGSVILGESYRVTITSTRWVSPIYAGTCSVNQIW